MAGDKKYVHCVGVKCDNGSINKGGLLYGKLYG